MTPEQQAYIQHFVGCRPYKLQGLSLEASHRQYYRLEYGTRMGARLSFVVVLDEHLRAYTSRHANKMPFVYWQKILHQQDLCVPGVVAIEAPLGLMLLEDLGSSPLSHQPTVENYQRAIEQLVGLQGFSLPQSVVEACRPAFTAEFLFNEMHFAFEHCVQQYYGLGASEAQTRALVHEMQQICTALAQQPHVLCHRDFHSRNLMCHKGAVYMIDFQDARLGPSQYDLISLLYDAYSPLNDTTRNQLLTHYKNFVAEAPLSKAHLQAYVLSDEFDRHLNLQILQRVFKACGSFASFYNLKGDARYLKYLKPCVRQLKRSLELTNFNNLSKLCYKLLE